MNLYNITHASDFDGMSSAAFLVRYHGLPLRNIVFANYDAQRFQHMIKCVRALGAKDSMFVVSDFAVNDNTLPKFAALLSYLNRNGNHIIFMDHHIWSRRAIDRIAPMCDFMIVGENREKCGAELVYAVLCRKDGFGKRLAGLAHLADFNIKPKSKATDTTLRRIAGAIRYINTGNLDRADGRLRVLISKIAKGKLNDRYIVDIYNRYARESKANIETLTKNTKTFTANGMKVAVGFSKNLHSTQACAILNERFGSGISIYIDTAKRSGHVRSIDSIDSVGISESFRGGGHPQASGFILKDKRFNPATESGRNALIKKIENAAGRARRIRSYEKVP